MTEKFGPWTESVKKRGRDTPSFWNKSAADMQRALEREYEKVAKAQAIYDLVSPPPSDAKRERPDRRRRIGPGEDLLRRLQAGEKLTPEEETAVVAEETVPDAKSLADAINKRGAPVDLSKLVGASGAPVDLSKLTVPDVKSLVEWLRRFGFSPDAIKDLPEEVQAALKKPEGVAEREGESFEEKFVRLSLIHI